MSQQAKSKLATLVLVLLFLGVVSLYGYLALLTGKRLDKDWSHLWLGGRMIVAQQAAHLYDPAVQLDVYRRSDPDNREPAIWGGRYELLGCFNYPPPAAVGYALLAWLPMQSAAIVNAYVNIILMLVVSWLVARRLTSNLPLMFVAVALLVYPAFFVNLSLGQNGVVNAAIVVVAWSLAYRRYDLCAGVVLGMLVYKPNWLLAVAWIPLVFGRWRVLAGITIGSGAVVGITALVTGLQPFWDYLEQFQRVARLHNLPGYKLDLKYSAMGLFRKWFGIGATATLLGWASAAVVAVVTVIRGWGCWRPGSTQFNILMACSLAASQWLNPHVNYYDLILCAVCFMVLLSDLECRRLGRMQILAPGLFLYIAIPLDAAMGYSRAVPLPSLALLALWFLLVRRLKSPQSSPKRAGSPEPQAYLQT